MKKQVVCAISGGVDSAVTALLLKKNGYNVTGVFMRNWDVVNEVGRCFIDKDCEDAEFVCRHLGIKFREVNFVKEYWNDVFSQLIAGYELGWTPNPDVLCNKHIKFGHFFKHAIEMLGADVVATGHYARNSAGQFLQNADSQQCVKLLCSVDQSKDQTLFLSQISQTALRCTMFPVGGLMKSAVRTLALEAGLESIVRKKESTGICFIGTRHFQNFIDQYIEPKPGFFIDLETNATVGRHRGVHCWTIGQRALIGGLNKAYFVIGRDASTRSIIVSGTPGTTRLSDECIELCDIAAEINFLQSIKFGKLTTLHSAAQGTNHPALFSDSITAGPIHWISEPLDELTKTNRSANTNNPSHRPGSTDYQDVESSSFVTCQFRFQHTYPLTNCRVRSLGGGMLDIQLEEPIRALACGQYAVLYRDKQCLGGAMITRVGPSLYDKAIIRDSDRQSRTS